LKNIVKKLKDLGGAWVADLVKLCASVDFSATISPGYFLDFLVSPLTGNVDLEF
jgi:hypothetical protein